MNNIISSVPHQIRFRIQKEAPPNVLNMWKRLKKEFETGGPRHNENVVHEWLSRCELECNKSLPYLDRCEGGIGGNNNQIHKQMRFRDTDILQEFQKDNDIVIDQIYNTDTEQWTYAELRDLIQAFQYFSDPGWVDGVIEIRL